MHLLLKTLQIFPTIQYLIFKDVQLRLLNNNFFVIVATYTNNTIIQFYVVHAYIQSGRTPLIAACEGGHFEIAWLLIEKRASLNQQDHVHMHISIVEFRSLYAICVIFMKSYSYL